jgi:hypothetical protein
MKTTITYDYVKNFISGLGYELLETIYVNSKSPLKFKCNKGHIDSMKWESFSIGSKCKNCYVRTTKISLEDIKEYFKKENYELLETEYVNSKTKMSCKCDKGHITKICWNAFQAAKRRCSVCAILNMRYSIDDVRKFVESILSVYTLSKTVGLVWIIIKLILLKQRFYLYLCPKREKLAIIMILKSRVLG